MRLSPLVVSVSTVLCLAGMTAATTSAQNPALTITVDAHADRRPISPDIYGVAYGDSTTLADLNVPLNRSGGNHTSRYNWQLNADNRGFDWYFESVPYASSVAGEVGDTFIAQSRSAGAEPMLTIPMVGWVAKLGANRSKLASFSIAKYGAQTGNDWQWFPDAGSGVWLNGHDVTGNDPNDANVPADSAYQLGWMQHLTSRWGSAGAGGLRYYLLDNEPSIWFGTHRDVHPTGPTMDEVRDKIVDYARRVKNNDPGALVVAPEEWGWDGYRYSGYDQQWGSLHGWSSFPDRAAHGGWDYLPWLLDQLRRQSATDGRRLLDVFSVHYYPQGGEFSDSVTQSMQQLRNTSTRSLWDPSYVDQSWIADRVQLVPRLRGWVDAYYPGTMIAVTEYNWGAEGHINGATAQADVLGIFGREGLDLAARWTTPAAATPTYKAIKMYRNYDGNRSTFGDTSVRATGPDPDVMAPFAAVRTADGALTIMVVTKYLAGTTPTTILLANFPVASPAQAWQLTSANTITRLGDIPVSGGTLNVTLPPQSVTLIVVTPGGFADVPASHPFFSWIEAVFAAGITGGCSVSPPQYCPDAPVTRDQMAVFLLRGIHGAGDEPPAATGTMFADVPATHPFAAWIEQLGREGITGGCSTSPPQYCPAAGVTRGQMAVFLLRAKHGAGYQPPAATGAMFTDVPVTHPFATWIEQLAREGITGGCAASPLQYCPDATVTRGQMAVFLVRTFNLPM
jgi:hypothetical protein